MSSISVELLQHPEHKEEIMDVWSSLCHSSVHSFFLSWEWTSCWLDSLPENENIKLVIVKDRGVNISAFFIGSKTIHRSIFVTSKSIFLNTTGDEILDNLYIEHNGFLTKPGISFSPISILEQAGIDWNEFVFPAVSEEAVVFTSELKTDLKYTLTEKREICYYVDLEKVRECNFNYVSLLSKKRRYQVRRAMQYYQKSGDVNMTIANNVEQALAMFEELIFLQIARSKNKNMQSSFYSSYFVSFHKKLIRELVPKGMVELLHIKCADKTIGILYNFIYKGRVLFYQCGYVYEDDPYCKPGYISLIQAIEYYARNNQAVFDFLAGDAQYKKVLATNSIQMFWITLQKNKLIFQLERKLKKFMLLIKILQ